MGLGRSRTFQVVDTAGGNIIADRATEAASFGDRLIGLLRRSDLAPGEALWLTANGIHTLGMRFAIDVVVLDSEGRVLRMAQRLPPNRILWPVRGGKITVELPAGTIERAGLSARSVLVRSDA